MAPSPITEDYYMILEVDRTATTKAIVSSYKRLALKLHPDRNARHDATEAFQRLGRAYETLKDESKRQTYDLIYPSISQNHAGTQSARTPPSPNHSGSVSERAQISSIQKSKQERNTQWHITKNSLDLSIFGLQRTIWRLEQEIKAIDILVAADAEAEAQKNSWTTWLLSIYKKGETEEEKARLDIKRQERRIERDLKERRLDSRREELKIAEEQLIKAKKVVDMANMDDDQKIRVIQARIWARENRERLEREKAERERVAKLRKHEQEERAKREREAAEALRKRQDEARAAQQKQYEEEFRRWQEAFNERPKYQSQNTQSDRTSSCDHGGWWPKVQGRAACPECSDSWTYLLQCPGCDMLACPKCQARIRPRINRYTARKTKRVPPRVRTPSPDFEYYPY